MIYLDNGDVVPVDKSELPIGTNDVDLNSVGNPLKLTLLGNIHIKNQLEESYTRNRYFGYFC